MNTPKPYKRAVPNIIFSLVVVFIYVFGFNGQIFSTSLAELTASAKSASAPKPLPTTPKLAPAKPSAFNPCKEYGIQMVEKHAWLPKKYKVLSQQPMDNLCEIAIESDNKYITLYTYKDYVMVGDLFKDKKAVTQDLVDKIEGKVIAENRDALEKCVALTYTPKERNIHRSMYMIVTPGCHFCEDAEEEIEFVSERYGIAVKMIIYDSKTRPQSVAAICQNIPINEFSSPEFKAASTETCEKGKTILTGTLPVIDKIGINGFPTFIFDTGKKVVGGNMKNLEQQIVLTLAEIEPQIAMVPNAK